MDFFLSGTFWFIEGILCTLAVIGLITWMQDRNIRLNWWQWILAVLWILLFGFTITFITTSLGEGEPTAAYRGGIFFGIITVVSLVGLWRVCGFPGFARKKKSR